LQEPDLHLPSSLQEPDLHLLSIANAVGDLELLYPKVVLPANIIVDRLEKDSKAPEEKVTLQE
jgi:hypothetical protein